MKNIELYSLATPNGQKVSIALEEMQIPYTAHRVDIMRGDQFTPEFVKINPNSKIPAIVDPEGPDGKSLAIMESGAILIYLAQKTKKFYPEDPRLQSEVLQWLFFQVGGVGPMFGQFGHFYKFAKEKCQDPYPVQRYATEAKRLLKVLDTRLSQRSYLVGEEYSIADMAIMPWVHALSGFYEAQEILGLSDYPHVSTWMQRLLERPATAKGMTILS